MKNNYEEIVFVFCFNFFSKCHYSPQSYQKAKRLKIFLIALTAIGIWKPMEWIRACRSSSSVASLLFRTWLIINCWATSLPTLAMTSIIKWRSFTHRSVFSLHRFFRNLSASSFRSESMRRLTLLCNILTHSVRPTAATNQNKPYGNISNLQNC